MADAHRVVVYYQTQYQTDQGFPTSPSISAQYVSPLPLLFLVTHLILAAIHINAVELNPPFTITLNDNSPGDPLFVQMWRDIAVMQRKGTKVLGMLGGAAQGTFHCLSGENFSTYYPKLVAFIRQYKLDGLDIDVEEDMSLNDIIHLITQLKHDFGNSFIISMAPVAGALDEQGNLSGFDYLELERRIGNQIGWYNAQFYSGFGDLTTDKQYIELVEFGSGLDPSRLVALTLTNPFNGEGWVQPHEVVASIEALTKKYGWKFGGVGGWEYFNSFPNPGKPWQWASLMSQALRNPNTPPPPETKRSRIMGTRDLFEQEGGRKLLLAAS